MAEKSTFFNSVSGDRKYKAEDMAAHFAKVLTNGVFPSGTQLQATEDEGMKINVSAGSAWINGYAYHNDSDYTLSFDAADGVLNRIDRIVVRWGRLARSINLAIIKGTPASTPVAPAIVRSADYYDLGIATVEIDAGITAITQAMITDTRLDSSVCGFVSSLIQPDTSGWFTQFDDAFTAAITGNQADWDVWFATVEDILDENVAGNLLNLINDLAGSGRTTETVKGNADALASHKAESATEVHLAKNIGIEDAEDNFTATDVEGAMQELFTNVSSGKDLVGTAITDVDPNVTVPTDPTFAELATAIGQISTGKKWATGNDIMSTNNKITVSGLAFRPKIIIANIWNVQSTRKANIIIMTDFDLLYYGSAAYGVGVYNNGSTNQVTYITTNKINNDGFEMPTPLSDVYYDWIAYE